MMSIFFGVCPLLLQFPASTQIAAMTHDREELPLEFPDGTLPVACCVSIYDSSTDKKVGVGSLMAKAVTPPLPFTSWKPMHGRGAC